jgi:hypothetical protein
MLSLHQYASAGLLGLYKAQQAKPTSMCAQLPVQMLPLSGLPGARPCPDFHTRSPWSALRLQSMHFCTKHMSSVHLQRFQ